MAIANAINKQVIIGKQSAQGTVATDGGTSQKLRFLKFNQGEERENYKSAEHRPDRQVGDVNLGPRECNGTMYGELSPLTYKDFTASILRKGWAAGGSITNLSDVVADSTTGAAGTFTTTLGSFITTGKFKVGDVVRWTGFAGGNATANNNHNMLITDLTDTVMTVLCLDGNPVVDDAAGDTVSCAVVGKKCWVPASGHTEDWWTIEHYYSDLDLSEVFYDCKPSKMSVKVAATGIPTIDFDILGLNVNMLTTSASPYFSAPAAITTTGQCLAAKAVIMLSGTAQTVATSFNVDITGNNKTLPAVISSVTKPGISDGVLEVSGSLSVYFENETIRDMFRNETDAAIYAVLPLSNAADADFVAFTLPACVLTTATKDGDQEIVQTVSFQAKFNAAGDDGSTCTVNSLATTISIQDSKVS